MPRGENEGKCERQAAATALEQALRSHPLAINRFLIDRTDPAFSNLDAQIQTKVRRKSTKMKWKVLHKNLWSQLRKDTPRAGCRFGNGSMPPHWLRMIKRYHFTAREIDICRMQLAKHRRLHGVRRHTVFFDVSQSAHRVPRGVNACCTILPSGRILVAQDDAVRPLFGVEALALQGLDLSSLPNAAASARFSHSFLTDVAGNAYSTPQACLACFISLCIFDLPRCEADISLRRTLAAARTREHAFL